MNQFQAFIELISQISMVVFAITTVIMLFALKKKGYSPEGVHVKHKLDFNLDLRFFGDLRKGNKFINEKSLIPIINKISFYITIIGVVSIFALVVFNEATTY